MGGRLAPLPLAGAGRPALDRSALGKGARRSHPGGHRTGSVLWDRGHPTTLLCIELLLDLERGSLLDLGCGSGVFGIAARKLGFDPVLAVDKDAVAVEATERNAASNGVAVAVRLADARRQGFPGFDVGVVNVGLEEVEQVAGRLRCKRLVTSGYLVSDAPRLPGYRQVSGRTAEGWAAHLFAAG